MCNIHGFIRLNVFCGTEALNLTFFPKIGRLRLPNTVVINYGEYHQQSETGSLMWAS